MGPKTAITPVLIPNEPIQAEHQQATDKPVIDNQQVDQFSILYLSHSTRDQLITNFNQLSTILQCDTPIPEDAKLRIRKKIDNSVRLLMDLSPFEYISSTDPQTVFEEILSIRLTVRLSTAARLKVIGHLIAIRDAVKFDHLIGGETKSSLIAKNREIIDQLLDLTYIAQGDQSDEDAHQKKVAGKLIRDDVFSFSIRLSTV